MDSIWSTRRYVPVSVDIDLLTVKGKQILKAASGKTKRASKTPPQQQNRQQQQLQQQQLLQHQQKKQDQQHLQQPQYFRQSQMKTFGNPVENQPLNPTVNTATIVPVKDIKPVTSVVWPRRKPLEVSINDVCLSINKETILSKISCLCRPGEVLAVMGPSGAGKTSLLNVMSGRVRPTSGNITVNGEPLSKRLKKQICYVLQQDIFFTDLTLRQTLVYTALLRLPDTMSYQDKISHVDHVLDILDLKRCQDTIIGSIMNRGLSGGEKKRANIACELFNNPSIMLLDEPTSGLDSSTAYSLIATLKQFAAKENKTVIMTLHQPSSQIFYMIDRLLLLCNGQNAYFGDTKKVVGHFARIGLPVAPHYNPADFILEQVKGPKEIQDKLIQSAKEGISFRMELNHQNHMVTMQTTPSSQSFYSKYLSLPTVHAHSGLDNNQSVWNGDCTVCSQNCHFQGNCPTDLSVSIDIDKKEYTVYNKIVIGEEEDSGRSSWSEETGSQTSASSSAYDEDSDAQWPTSFLTQFKVLTERNFSVARPFILSKLNWVQTIALALIAGLLWFQVPRTEENLKDIQGWMFFSTSYWTMFVLFTALQSCKEFAN
ncbi:hypothetical protein SK128_000156 [Halocaridina rubra]|uniref:ABC transporter domain-containing protein n=1 Tax=Halocaridina rubra TaxID=373956 RepID=A0AAN8X0Z8_HALRR